MISQMVLASEGFTTNLARIGPFVCVRSFVDEEVVGLAEVASTVFAYELLPRSSWPSNLDLFTCQRCAQTHTS